MRRLVFLFLIAFLSSCSAPVSSAFVSPLSRSARFTSHLPLVEGQNYTAHCTALDTYTPTGGVPGQLNSLPEGSCGHVWWTPLPLPENIWASCRTIAECQALVIPSRITGVSPLSQILQKRPGATIMLLNEPNNPDTANGGWPTDPASAARLLRPVVQAIRAGGGKASCCSVYLDPTDSLRGVDWMRRYTAAGGQRDITGYHVFTRTEREARSIMATAEAAWNGPLLISEAGWGCPVTRAVQAKDSPRYVAVFTLHSARCK